MEPLGVVRFILHFLHQQGADRTCKVLPIQAHCNSPRKRKLIISANLHLKCECLKHSSIVQVFRLIVHSPPLVSMSLLTLELGSFDFRVMNMTIRPIYYHLIFTQFYSGFCLRWFFGAWSDQTHFITSVCVCVTFGVTRFLLECLIGLLSRGRRAQWKLHPTKLSTCAEAEPDQLCVPA